MTKDQSNGFDPRMLVETARQQAPEFSWLPEALSNCESGEWEGPAYVRFVSCRNPNQPGAEWQFQTNVILDHEELGMVVLDLLKGDRLGGIELVDRIE